MINLTQGHRSVSSGLIQFLKSILARFVLHVDADEAAAALAKDVERKAKEAARSKARRDARKLRKFEPVQPLTESADSEVATADSPKESAVATADSVFESADSSKTPRKCASPSVDARPPPRLSLLKNNLDLKERESRRAAALPHDWGPDAKTQEFAIKHLGDAAAVERCFAKFRVHHETSGRQWGPKEWQSQARGWVLKEIDLFGPQRPLPLPPVPLRKPPSGFYARNLSEQLAAWDRWWRRNKGCAIPRNRDGGWWVKSEWPPDHDETRRAS